MAGVAVALLSTTPSAAITLGQLDDFQNGTVMGWTEGGLSPNQPTNQPSGGPGGAGDRYLRNVSSGMDGSAGGRMVMFNDLQWTGDYIAAGVTRIEMQMANFGTTTLHMRIAIQGLSTQYGSTTAFVLPADGIWRSATFGLSASDLTNIGGLASLATVLSAVDRVRILSASAGPAWRGDLIAATLGVDNILAAGAAAAPPPVPDGTFGSPMRASRTDTAGTMIELTWDVSTCQASGYHALFGSLANVSTLGIAGGVCSMGNTGIFTWTGAPAGDLWFLVVGDDAAAKEGSWGKNSSGLQRGGTTASGVCAMVDRDNSGTCP